MWSNDPNVDPVGACVGARGARVRMVTNELRGEKVDIVPFSEDPVEFVARALQPARVREVLLDEETGVATVIVPDFQLSLAIGREGQNARLAARLTGWRIDIKSETQVEEERNYANQDWAEGAVGRGRVRADGVAAGRGRRGHLGRGLGRRRGRGRRERRCTDPVAEVAARPATESDPEPARGPLVAPEEAAVHSVRAGRRGRADSADPARGRRRGPGREATPPPIRESRSTRRSDRGPRRSEQYGAGGPPGPAGPHLRRLPPGRARRELVRVVLAPDGTSCRRARARRAGGVAVPRTGRPVPRRCAAAGAGRPGACGGPSIGGDRGASYQCSDVGA